MTQPQTTEQPVIQTPQELGMQLRMHREAFEIADPPNRSVGNG